MHGIASATGAITIVNALSTGIGCAAGVALTATAEIELLSPDGPSTIRLDASCDTPLVRQSLLAALRRLAPGEDLSAALSVRSQIPPAKGLKSSSAVSSAVVRAVSSALKRPLPATEVARLSSEISKQIGLSATGAFDDALAGVSGGLVVTDNRTNEILRADRADPAWEAVLWIPRKTHRASTEWKNAFSSVAGEGRAAVEAALAGDYARAMDRNTELVERVMGYSYRAIREEVRRKGAITSGVSGMGPTLAAIVPREKASAALGALPVGGGDRLRVDFVGPHVEEMGGKS